MTLVISFINSFVKRDDDAQKASRVNQSKNDVSLDLDSYDKGEIYNSALKIKYDISEKLYLESVSVLRKFNDKNAKDWDFSRGPMMFHVTFDDTHTTMAEELRLHGSFERFNFLLGLYGEDYEHENRVLQSMAMPGPGGKIMAMDKTITDDYNDRSYGIFTHLSYGLTDCLRILGGVRFDREEKEFKQLKTGKTIDENFDEISPKISLEYDFTDNIMIYTTIAKGYRGGGFNKNLPLSGYEDKTTFDEERLISYEAGFKSSLLNRKLMLNGSFYYMDIDDMQSVNPLDNGREYISNAAEAHSVGGELELNWNIIPSLKLYCSIGYNDTEFDEYIIENKDGTTTDLDGNKNHFAPEYNFNLGAQYRSGTGLYARCDINGYDSMYFDKENKVKKDAYQLINAKVGYESEHYDVYLYGKNIFDEDHDSKGYFINYTIYEDPREIGVNLALRF